MTIGSVTAPLVKNPSVPLELKVGDSLYKDGACRLCGRKCHTGTARDNHARKHQREGRVLIKGWGGPGGYRRFEINASTIEAASKVLGRVRER